MKISIMFGTEILSIKRIDTRRYQRPRGIKRVSAASLLLASIPSGGHGCLSVVIAVCCQVEVSATG